MDFANQLVVPLADNSSSATIPFTVAHTTFAGKPPQSRVASVLLFSSNALLANLLGCPTRRDGVVLHHASLSNRLTTKALKTTSWINESYDQSMLFVDSPISFAQALRWLDRCSRLEHTECAVRHQADCDDVVFRFASSVDFSVGGTLPLVRTCPTRTTSRPSMRFESEWLQSVESRVDESFSLRVIKPHILDTLELTARVAFPNLLRPGKRILDIGAGGGLIDEYLERKHGVNVTAYDVLPPSKNVFSIFAYAAKGGGSTEKQLQSRVPVFVFNGSHLPGERDKGADAVLFNSVLHHAAHHAPTLLKEAQRISRRYIILIEDVMVKGERNPRESYIHRRHGKHGQVPANSGAPRGIFRSQAEWTHLLQSGGEWTVTRIGSVVPRNITGAFRLFHKLSKTFSTNELTGPTYQRVFVAERCRPSPRVQSSSDHDSL